MAKRFDGRRVLVTGGGSGIGRAAAAGLEAEGAAVAVLDNRQEALDALDFEAATFLADVTDPAEAVTAAAAALGGLDGVVNSAGIDLLSPFAEMALADWQRVLAVNLTGAMAVCQAALPALTAAGGGTIVNVASGAGLRPLADRTAYCTSKAGLVMLSKTLALELADRHIRVNAVCPGAVDTPLFRGGFSGAEPTAADIEMVRARYALQRVAEPEEIAAAILFLTAAESSYITGTALAVDGGRTFH